jgi:hypothetical protein
VSEKERETMGIGKGVSKQSGINKKQRKIELIKKNRNDRETASNNSCLLERDD